MALDFTDRIHLTSIPFIAGMIKGYTFKGQNMESLSKYISEYKKQMEKGTIQKAYQGLMEYIMYLRTRFIKKFSDWETGNLYQGYMDMTYFPIFTKSLKDRKLKIAVVSVHQTSRFEIWLSAQNKQIQAEYRKLFKEDDWNKYTITASAKGVDSIIEHTLVDDPDFGDLDALTEQIETGVLNFVADIETFLSKH
jgi:hypothetical protein